jgi:hypothetical protein
MTGTYLINPDLSDESTKHPSTGPVLSERLILRPFDKLRVVLSNVEGRHAQDERESKGSGQAPVVSLSHHVFVFSWGSLF